MNINYSLAEHIAKVENLTKQIKDSGEPISDAAIMTKILGTLELSLKYRNIRQAWLSVEKVKQIVANLTARLLDEEAALTSYEEPETALATLGRKHTEEKGKKKIGKDLSKISCFNCKRKDHFMSNCPEPRKYKNKNFVQKNKRERTYRMKVQQLLMFMRRVRLKKYNGRIIR